MSTHIDVERDAPTSNGPTTSKLAKFRLMSGVSTPSGFDMSRHDRPGPNVGIYARVISEEKRASIHYRVVSILINSTFFIQILIGAILTATGRGSMEPYLSS